LAALPSPVSAARRPLADIESVERARSSAMTHRDLKALQSMLADNLIYCHSNGRCENKAQLLESLQSSRIRYRAVSSCRCGRAPRRAP
jgi:hypothetical protein